MERGPRRAVCADGEPPAHAARGPRSRRAGAVGGSAARRRRGGDRAARHAHAQDCAAADDSALGRARRAACCTGISTPRWPWQAQVHPHASVPPRPSRSVRGHAPWLRVRSWRVAREAQLPTRLRRPFSPELGGGHALLAGRSGRTASGPRLPRRVRQVALAHDQGPRAGQTALAADVRRAISRRPLRSGLTCIFCRPGQSGLHSIPGTFLRSSSRRVVALF